MSLESNIAAYSPRGAATLTVQEISVQIGTGANASPVDEVFVYNPSTMPPIYLSYPVAPGTWPAVYLNGLRMTTRDPDASIGGDVAFASQVNPTTGETTTAIIFCGSTYAVASADIVHVRYWTPA